MILAALLLPVAVVAIVLLVERLRLPVFLAIMATVLGYGLAANMAFNSIGKSFGVGFVQSLDQVGLLVVAGALATGLLAAEPLRPVWAGDRRRRGRPRRLGRRRPGASSADRGRCAAPGDRPGPHPARRPGAGSPPRRWPWPPPPCSRSTCAR
jgi:hypothetical protein